VYLFWGEDTLVLGKDELYLLIAKTFDVDCTQSSFTVSDLFFVFWCFIQALYKKNCKKYNK